jgi:hypothetical protein
VVGVLLVALEELAAGAA